MPIIVDLGSNTFSWALYCFENGGFHRVAACAQHVRLFSDSPTEIGPEAWQRAQEAIRQVQQFAAQTPDEPVHFIGTAALRSATNGHHFARWIQEYTGRKVEIISGEEEARLIYKAHAAALDMSASPHIIMDIGGGSVELIMVYPGKPIWSASFPIGLGLLMHAVVTDEIFTQQDETHLKQFILERIQPFIHTIDSLGPCTTLVVSGAMYGMVYDAVQVTINPEAPTPITYDQYLTHFHHVVIGKPYKILRHEAHIPENRLKGAPYGATLLKTILDISGQPSIVAGLYGVKEGYLMDCLEKQNN